MSSQTMQPQNLRDAVLVVLQSHMQHLRSIKDMELKWLDRYSAIALPIAGFIVLNPRNVLGAKGIALLMAFSFVLTIWIQVVLRKERRSYYRVMRAVVRAQNYLGLLSSGFISSAMANAPFPRGMGPDPNTDGTQPTSSFLHRLSYAFLVLAATVAGAAFQHPDTLAYGVIFLVADLYWLWAIRRKDDRDLRAEAIAEKDLLGSDPAWYP